MLERRKGVEPRMSWGNSRRRDSAKTSPDAARVAEKGGRQGKYKGQREQSDLSLL